MAKLLVKILPTSDKNFISFSKNYRIFSTIEPVSCVSKLTNFEEDIITSSPAAIDLTYLRRYIRYSRNKEDWSLWYLVSPDNISEVENIVFEETSEFYFEIKYEYDNGTANELNGALLINEIRLRFEKTPACTVDALSVSTQCTDEKCSSLIAKVDPSFKPYEVDSAVSMFKDLSFFTNKMFGHTVVYFRTLPESNSGDYVFKEWTLYKNIDRKCIKVLVPKNAFPSNAPKFSEFELGFQLPFEINIDHRYFQSIFGAQSEPRYRDFLYFPLINRMFEIQGAYLHRGFMMEPVYWKIQLKKYNPNIDMLLKDETRHFLDNVITGVDDLFGKKVEDDTKDAIMPEQYSTISSTFDSSRKAIHPELRLVPLKYYFNHASLIENYYDLSKINITNLIYELTNDSPETATSINYVNLKSINTGDQSEYGTVIAYQNSGPFKAWQNNALITNDKNIRGTNLRYLRVRGPFDTIPNHEGQSISGRYIRIEGYKDLTFKTQRDILTESVSGKEQVTFRIREAAVVYNSTPKFNTSDICNLSFTCLFNIPTGIDTMNFIDGYDNESSQGIRISGQFIKYFGSGPEGDLNLTVEINTVVKNYTIANFKSGNWHGLVFSVSNEFKQCGMYVYTIAEDVSDLTNHIDFVKILESTSSFQVTEFNLTRPYVLMSSNLLIANIRLFNTMLKEDQHDFILSQQFIKDESLLILIDNCRPQINLPFITTNR